MTLLARAPTLGASIALGLPLGSMAVAAILALGAGAAHGSSDRDALAVAPISIVLGAPPGPRFSEPVTVSVETIGAIPADEAVRGCPGFVPASEGTAARGGLMVEAARAIGDLYIHIDGADTAAAIIEGPDGIHHCAVPDDNGLISHRFDALGNGRLHIRPAIAEPGIVATARVVLSRTAVTPRDLLPFSADDLAPPRHGTVPFSAAPDRQRQHLAAAPIQAFAPASTVDPSCAGYVDLNAADVVLTLDEREESLSLFAESREDLVLMVLDPSGVWHCDDDTHGLNPAVTLSPAEAGAYHLHVGGYSPDISGAFELFANRGTPRWRYSTAQPHTQPYDSDAGPDTGVLGFDAAPSGGRLSLETGAVTDRAPIRLANRTGEAADISPDCVGFMDLARPDTVLTLDRIEERVTIYAVSEADTTLMVRTPAGVILCNDDFMDLNPAIVMIDADPGDYAIWVGSYDGFSAEATVGATRGFPDWVEIRHALFSPFSSSGAAGVIRVGSPVRLDSSYPPPGWAME